MFQTSLFCVAITFLSQSLEQYLFSSYDCIGLLLMIRLTHAHQQTMAVRSIPCLDKYFNSVKMLLWPRFKSVFDMNLQVIDFMSINEFKLGS